jgi:hypothetical protein
VERARRFYNLDAILEAMDQARKSRNEGRCVINGFHSPVEKKFLKILL